MAEQPDKPKSTPDPLIGCVDFNEIHAAAKAAEAERKPAATPGAKQKDAE